MAISILKTSISPYLRRNLATSAGLSEKEITDSTIKTSGIGLATIGAGLAFPETVGIGIGVGLLELGITSPIFEKLGRFFPKSKDDSDTEDDQYTYFALKNPFQPCVQGPITEECIFRFCLQDHLFPALLEGMGGHSGSMPYLSIFATSCLFGRLHLANGNSKYFYMQSVEATISGMVYGWLYYRYGFASALAAHMSQNIMITLHSLHKEKKSQVDGQKDTASTKY